MASADDQSSSTGSSGVFGISIRASWCSAR
jgi:hypothetical protein